MNKLERFNRSMEAWAESADHDKSQLKLSVAIGSTGLVTSGVGIGLAWAGHPAEGAAAFVTGGGLTYVGAREAVSDFEDYSKSTSVAAKRQGQAEGLDIATTSSRDV